MKKMSFWIVAALFAGLAATLAFPAFAANGPQPWEINFQPAATPVAERIHEFHMMLLYIITAITVFVMLLLLIVVVKFNAKANPKPSNVTHNVGLEIAWTAIPVLILLLIAVPSLKLLYYGDRTHNPDMTLKVTGYQWYWGYEYPDSEGLSFTSYMVPQNEITGDQVRLLSTTAPVVLPIETNVQILVTAADVIHSFAVPAFGIKTDAVPGRTNETWVRITKPGVYYGQCSELCGKDHAFMPIEIHAVTKEEYAAWLEKAKAQYSYNTNDVPPAIQLAKVEVTE